MKEKFVLCLVELLHNMVIFLQIFTLHRSPLSRYGMSFVVSKPHLTCILHLSLTRHRQYHVMINRIIRMFDWIRICFDTVHSQGFSQKPTRNHITCQWGRDMEFCGGIPKSYQHLCLWLPWSMRDGFILGCIASILHSKVATLIWRRFWKFTPR